LLEEVHGKAEYKASKQPNWVTTAKRPTFVEVPKQGANECGFFCLKLCSTYDGDDLIEDYADLDVCVVLIFAIIFSMSWIICHYVLIFCLNILLIIHSFVCRLL
jgi:hypothetical protein